LAQFKGLKKLAKSTSPLQSPLNSFNP